VSYLEVNETHVLHGNQIGADEGYMINLAEHAHDASVIDARDEHR
jgi:hypothetical protein